MKRFYVKGMAVLLTLTLGLGLAGCKEKTPAGEVIKAETKVWSTWPSVKVLQNQKAELSYEEQGAQITIQMMKGETEGAQLLITAAEDIAAYDLTISELTDGKGNLISKEAITAYHQKYLVVNSKTDILNEDIIVGDSVPDMLLPLEVAKEYGENTIAAGKNQGITVEVTTSSETVPGIYTGAFTLMMDGKNTEIPVSVEVWDIEQKEKREFQSSFLIYSNALLAGEYEVSEELVERYQDFFLDYKINTFVIRTDNSAEKLAKEAVTFFEDNNYSSICLPNTMEPNYAYNSPAADKIVEYIKEIVKISSAKKQYFKYLYIYPAYFDEVDMYPEKQEEFINTFKAAGEWEKTLERALGEVKKLSEYRSFTTKLQKEVDEAIRNIPAVIPCTTSNTEWIDELGLTFCPYLSLFDEQSMSQRYQRQAEKLTNGELWTYTCVGPTNPYPTFHIDDYNLGTRVTGWMMKKHNINGYLYWAVNIFEPVNANAWRDVDPYHTAERASDCAGDGFLCYPGAYYGSEYPFPCIRLTAFRDTMDDYDMLSIYESLVNEKAKKYGIDVEFEACVEDLYSFLFNGTQYYNDDALVMKAREKLAQRILAIQSESELLAVPEKKSITLYSANATLTVDGTQMEGVACKGGYKYVVENQEEKGKEITVSSGDVPTTYYLNATKDVIVETVAKSADSKAFVLGGKVQATIVSEQKENAGAMERFRPYMQFDVKDMEGSSGLHFTFNLNTSKEVEGKVFFVMEDMTTMQVGSFLADKKSQEVEIDYHTKKFTDDTLKGVTAVRITFLNTDDDGKLLADREISLEDIYMKMR